MVLMGSGLNSEVVVKLRSTVQEKNCNLTMVLYCVMLGTECINCFHTFLLLYPVRQWPLPCFPTRSRL